LTALAIVDDMGAVMVIALFYSNALAWGALGSASVLLLILIGFNAIGFTICGLTCWWASCFGISGSLLAGVIATIILKTIGRGKISPACPDNSDGSLRK
jgi:Na+:H+ antiporter, NhaA family